MSDDDKTGPYRLSLRETVIQSEKVRADVDRLMQNVRPEGGPESPIYEIEMGHAVILSAFFAGLLIDSPIADSPIVWPLLEARAPAELLSDPRIQEQKEYLCRPLDSTPTSLLMKVRLLNDTGPWAALDRAIRASQTPDQSRVLWFLEMALER